MAEKKLLDDLKKNLMSNEELENVAGGDYEENLEIYNKICSLDFDKGQELQEKWIVDKLGTKSGLGTVLQNYLFKELKLKQVTIGSEEGTGNIYMINDKIMNHEKFMEFLDGMLRKEDDF